MTSRPKQIVLADDDPDDREMARRALLQSHIPSTLHEVSDGEELLEYLLRRGRYAPPFQAPMPSLILLDLNMPKKDGREALIEIKSNPGLRSIPVVVMTTSNAQRDVVRSYELGSNSFICKPVTLSALIEVMNSLGQYWFQTVTLPTAQDGERDD